MQEVSVTDKDKSVAEEEKSIKNEVKNKDFRESMRRSVVFEFDLKKPKH